MLTLAELFNPPTADQALETLLSTLESVGVPARSWRKGGAYRMILRVAAVLFAGLAAVITAFARAGFLDYAEGGWLTLLARYVYGVARPGATFATGRVLFVNGGGGVYTMAAGAVRVRAGTRVYVTTEGLSLLSVGAAQLVAVQAVEQGAASSCAPGLVDTLETVMLGVTVTNPESIVGSDELGVPELRQVCRDKLAALSMLGPRGAYAYAVAAARRSDGSRVDVNRVGIVTTPDSPTVTVYCASPAGVPVDSDLALVRESVELWARPDSTPAVVAAATPVALARTMTAWATATTGMTAAEKQALVEAALVAMVAAYPVGGRKKAGATQGYLFASGIDGTAKAAHSSIFAVDGVGADLEIDPGEVATLAATVTVREVP